MENITMNDCLVPECEQETKTRGLCPTHYMYAHRLITRGKTTWPTLEQEGKCLSSHAGPNPTKDWFLGNPTEANIKEERDLDLASNNDPDNPFSIELGEGK